MPRTAWGHRGQAAVAAGRHTPHARARRDQEGCVERRVEVHPVAVAPGLRRPGRRRRSRWPARARPPTRSATSGRADASSASPWRKSSPPTPAKSQGDTDHDRPRLSRSGESDARAAGVQAEQHRAGLRGRVGRGVRRNR